MGNPSFFQRAKRFLLGAPRDLFDPKLFHRVSLIAFFAWVGLGADGISSSAYGPEEAFLALGKHTSLAIFIAIATIITVFIISGSYSRIIEKFPMGGGGYILAAKLLGEKAGVVARLSAIQAGEGLRPGKRRCCRPHRLRCGRGGFSGVHARVFRGGTRPADRAGTGEAQGPRRYGEGGLRGFVVEM